MMFFLSQTSVLSSRFKCPGVHTTSVGYLPYALNVTHPDDFTILRPAPCPLVSSTSESPCLQVPNSSLDLPYSTVKSNKLSFPISLKSVDFGPSSLLLPQFRPPSKLSALQELGNTFQSQALPPRSPCPRASQANVSKNGNTLSLSCLLKPWTMSLCQMALSVTLSPAANSVIHFPNNVLSHSLIQ